RLLGFRNPLYADFGGPILAFLIISVIMTALGQFVHRKIDYHYKYNRHDAERAVWEMMHRRVGACLGALNGTVYFVIIALMVSIFGYFTIQTGGGENESKVLSFLGKAAKDLQETRMDKVVAPFNPASEKYFDASDLAGLLYHNRGLVDRLYNYPVFAAIAEEPAFKNLGQDRDLQRDIRGQMSLNAIFAHPKVQDVVSNNPSVVSNVLTMDFKDLKQYLETGVSPRFASEKILGNWAYDPLASVQLNRQLTPDVAASIWMRLQNELTNRFVNSAFTAFYDNKAKLALAPNMEGRASPLRAIPIAIPTRPGQFVTNYVALWFTTNATTSANGKWSGAAPNYLITLGNRNGTATSEGKVEDNKLAFQFEGKALAFTRLPD
ncbi:MAG TPA: hypothetical protein VNT99_05770, partial [Methylomirabilota bacterium]|nr:hypothetical protein [Methylomirabilota bacterium]